MNKSNYHQRLIIRHLFIVAYRPLSQIYTYENAGKKKKKWYATSVTDREAELKIAGRRVKQR